MPQGTAWKNIYLTVEIIPVASCVLLQLILAVRSRSNPSAWEHGCSGVFGGEHHNQLLLPKA